MTNGMETLAGLVAAAVDRGEVTFAQLSERAVDPETGYQPSANMLWKVARQKGVKLNPALVRAIAVGLRLPEPRVQLAAAYEFAGLVATELDGGTVVRDHDAEPGNMPKSRAVIAGWEEEEAPVMGNHSGE